MMVILDTSETIKCSLQIIDDGDKPDESGSPGLNEDVLSIHFWPN